MKVKLLLLALIAPVLASIALVWFVAIQVSGVLALLLAIGLFLGISRLNHSSSPLKAKLLERDDALFRQLCQSRVTGNIRRFYRLLPSDPRCRLCLGPFRGVGKLLGIRPSRKNPNFCPG